MCCFIAMYTWNIVSKNGCSENNQKSNELQINLGNYFKTLKEENPNRCSHKLAPYWKWTPTLTILNNVSKLFAKKPCKFKQTRSNQTLVSVNVPKPVEPPYTFQAGKELFWKVHRNEITFKSEVQTALFFDISTTFQIEMSKWHQLFVFQKQIKISFSKLNQFFMKIA